MRKNVLICKDRSESVTPSTVPNNLDLSDSGVRATLSTLLGPYQSQGTDFQSLSKRTSPRSSKVLNALLQMINKHPKPGKPEGLPFRPWRLVFIVPPSDEAYFKSQRLKGEGDTPLDEWVGKVHQYVLRLDVIGKKPTVEIRPGPSEPI